MIEIAGARVFLGDCVEVMKSLPENSVDSIVTDPPYGLEFMGKDWDAPWKKSGSFNGNIEETAESAGGVSKFANHRVRYQKGLEPMLGFQLWATEWATECLRVLKPGGHILAFGGSRTWHRLAVAVEDAGFELRDSIAWLYGSGFPKSLDVSKAIDKRAGAEREVLGNYEIGGMSPERENFGANDRSDGKGMGFRPGSIDITAPATSEAKAWEGWGTALKPAFEPVVVGRKPLVGTVAENVLLWGVGGLNIDGSRIGTDTVSTHSRGVNGAFPKRPGETSAEASGRKKDQREGLDHSERVGRWPANVILDEVTAGLLDEQSGVSKPKPGRTGRKGGNGGALGEFAGSSPDAIGVWPEDVGGGASRFFYVAKASKRDRNEGLEELELVSANSINWSGDGMPVRQDGTERKQPQKQNFHPTVKPTQLMRYLIKLVTPPGGTVLDPFTGSGSTGKAALLDGFQFVGAELTEEYLPIIEGRLRWASEQEAETDDTLF
jgi:DNA modification methylase